MAEAKKPQVPLLAVVVGGLVVGAVLFGAFRGLNAQPLPAVPTADPFGALPVPGVPAVEPSPLPAVPPVEQTSGPLPPVQQTGGVLPPVSPPTLPPLPALPKSDLPVPVSPPVAPSPLPPVSPAVPSPDSLPVLPKPVEPLPPVDLKADTPVLPVPPPVALPPAKIDPIPDVTPKPVEPVLPKPVAVEPVLPKPVAVEPVLPKPMGVTPVLPKPVETPQPVQPVVPVAPPAAKPENVLRPDPSTLTVNPGPLPLVGSETLPPPRKVADETLPPPRPVVLESVAPPAAVPITTPHTPGTAPMTPASRSTLMTVVMGAALASAPAFAQEPKPADADAVKTLQKQIDDMKKDITFLKEQRNELNKQLNGIPESQRKTPEEKGAIIRLQEAEAAAEKMAAKVKELETQLAQKSVSEKTPVGGGGTITAGRGMVKLVNEYNVKVSMMVNGISYPLGVNEVKTVEVPEGKLKYELVEFPNAVAKETTIKEGETVTLRIK